MVRSARRPILRACLGAGTVCIETWRREGRKEGRRVIVEEVHVRGVTTVMISFSIGAAALSSILTLQWLRTQDRETRYTQHSYVISWSTALTEVGK
jgi:hypothetical protein